MMVSHRVREECLYWRLTRAYTKGASLAIKSAGIVQKVYGHALRVRIDYDLLGKLQYAANEKGWYIDHIEYEDRVLLTLIAEKSLSEEIIENIRDISHGKAEVSLEEEKVYFKEENCYYIEL